MDQIAYFDRYSQRECLEKVYGDRALRWTYETFPGRLTLSAVVKRAAFSRWYGWRMDRAASRKKIAPFIDEFGLDPKEFRKEPSEFESFNDFFARALKADARPIDTDANSIVFPADGRHLCIPDLSQAEGLFVKGQSFDLPTLVQDDVLARVYRQGSALLSRLCPTDYHRFHFPCDGVPGPTRLFNGPLYSVNPIALRRNIQILASNKRTLTELQSKRFGRVLLMEIGATCVGSIRQSYRVGAEVTKGDEKGYFRFGGSSTITLFEPGRIRFDQDLVEQSGKHRELYARMGDHAGRDSAAASDD